MRPDFVLGDRYGTSCAGELTDVDRAVPDPPRYSVSRNKPYAGGFITEHYGQPAAAPRAADRDQPQPLHGRAHAANDRRLRRCRSAISRGLARDGAGRGTRSARLRHERQATDGANKRARKEKGPPAGARRPKSREETPKEGMRYHRYRTAIIASMQRTKCKRLSP